MPSTPSYSSASSTVTHKLRALPSRPPAASSRMSDYEDEMDIDAVAPAAANDGGITFSAENTSALGKGKRIARDLPVEAEDSLPW